MGSDSLIAPMHSTDESDEPDFGGALEATYESLNRVDELDKIIHRYL